MFRRFLCLIGAILVLAACQKSPQTFHNTDITGVDYGKNFSLTDHTGKQRTLSDFKGKAVVLFFGYTQCPDVCPTTLAELAGAMKQLGPQAEKVQVIFVTVDPERDTQELLAQYAPAFDPRFLGMRGDLSATQQIAKDFKVFFQKNLGKQPGTYTIDHTGAAYVFDPQGRLRLFMRNGQPVQTIVDDLKIILS